MKTATASPVLVALLVALLTAIALAVPAGEARALTSTAPRASQTQALRAQLHKTRATLARAAAELAKIRTSLGSPRTKLERLEAEASRLQGVLVQTAGHLDAAEAETSALQARLDAIPTPLAVAVAQVQREVAYVQGGVSYSRGQLLSEAALDYVAGHVSDTAYGYLEVFGGVLPAGRPNSALADQAGFCRHAAVTFAAIVRQFGLQVRSVQFFYHDPGTPPVPDRHVAVEVLYDGGWHFFDPSFGQFWTGSSGGVFSISDVRAGHGKLQKNAASFTNVFEDAVLGNDSWFETDPTTTVLIGAAPLGG